MGPTLVHCPATRIHPLIFPLQYVLTLTFPNLTDLISTVQAMFVLRHARPQVYAHNLDVRDLS
jgi:hypothetical protein